MQVIYKDNMIEKIDEAVNGAMEHMVDIEEIIVSKVEWDMLRGELSRLHLYGAIFGHMKSELGERSIKVRGVKIVYRPKT